MSKRIVYIEPGEMLEIRIVREGVERNAKNWAYQARPSKILVLIKDTDMIAFADPAIMVVPWSMK